MSDEPIPNASSLGVLVPTQTELEEIFSTDPDELTDAQIDRVIAAFEAKATEWAKDEAAGKKQAAVPKLEGSAKDVLAALGLGKKS